MSIANRYKSSLRRYVDCMPRSFLFGKVYSQHIELCQQAEEGLIHIERYQRNALSATLKHALSTVPFYRKNYNIYVNNINEDNSFEVLQQFDYLDKATVMVSPKEFVSDRYKIESLLMKASGGSTGQGVMVFYNRRELGIERAYVEYPWYKFGFSSGSLLIQSNINTCRAYEEGPFGYGFRRVYLSCHHITPEWMQQVIDTLLKMKPLFLHGYPSVWVKVAEELHLAGLKLPVKGVLLCSEQVFPEQVSLLEEIFGPVSIGYGQTERAVIAYGELKNNSIRFKLMPTYSYAENTISQYGIPEIVGTNLFVKVMPLIRYKTQDLGEIETDKIVSIDGRVQEILITKNGNYISGKIVTMDPLFWDYVDSYQFVQNKPGILELHIVCKEGYNNDIDKLLLEKQVRRIGTLFDIQIVYVKQINKTKAGKQRQVVTNVK